jgi:hypothetical protein
MTEQQYIDKLFGVLDYFQSAIKDPTTGISPASDVKTRIITGRGMQDLSWIGELRNTETEKVDIWLLSIRGFRGVDRGEKGEIGVGYFNKPVKLGIYYFSDYLQGLDFNVGVSTNSEREFLTKQFKMDWRLETLENGCLPGNVYVQKWNTDTIHMKFTSETTHYAAWQVDLKLLQIQY